MIDPFGWIKAAHDLVLKTERSSGFRPYMRRSKRRILDMAGGTLWLIAVSTAFATLSLIWIGTPMARTAIAGVIGLAMLLLGINIGAMRAARGIPGELPPRTSEDQAMMRNCGRIVVVEIVGLAVVNSLCKLYGQDGLMAPLDLIIVGLHFVALTRVFRTPRYSVMGGCSVSFRSPRCSRCRNGHASGPRPRGL